MKREGFMHYKAPRTHRELPTGKRGQLLGLCFRDGGDTKEQRRGIFPTEYRRRCRRQLPRLRAATVQAAKGTK